VEGIGKRAARFPSGLDYTLGSAGGENRNIHITGKKASLARRVVLDRNHRLPHLFSRPGS